MKKKLLLYIIIFLLLSNQSNAQQVQPPHSPPKNTSSIQVDSGKIKISYAFNALDIGNEESYDDLHYLEIGYNMSKYYSYFVHNSDSLCEEWRKKNKRPQSVPNWLGAVGKDTHWSEYRYSEIFKDYTNNILIEYARMPVFLNKYDSWYSETIPMQNWVLSKDTLTIIDHLCQKATCNFRGRNFIAWFTMDIPISNGPWKFGGLPGLILKVYDIENIYVFECIKIENIPRGYPINKYNDYKNYTKIEREKLLKLQKDIHEDFIKISGLVPEDKNFRPEKIIYHPLELE